MKIRDRGRADSTLAQKPEAVSNASWTFSEAIAWYRPDRLRSLASLENVLDRQPRKDLGDSFLINKSFLVPRWMAPGNSDNNRGQIQEISLK
jgi:hypothetical protein